MQAAQQRATPEALNDQAVVLTQVVGVFTLGAVMREQAVLRVARGGKVAPIHAVPAVRHTPGRSPAVVRQAQT